MATTFKKKVSLYGVYNYTLATNTFSGPGTHPQKIYANNNVTFDYFLDTAVAGDSLVLVQPYNGGKQYNSVDFYIGTPLAATSISVIWEYCIRDGGTTTVPLWKPLQNVRDDTNAFQNSGARSVYFQIPDDWDNYHNENNQLIYYSFNIRCRIVSVTGLTEGGANSTTKAMVEDYRIILDSSVTLDDIYNSDKNGTSVLDSRTGLTTTDASARTFNSVLKPGDNKVMGGSYVYLTVSNWTGTTATIRLTGTDIDDNAQTEDIVVTGNGVTNTTKYWKTMVSSQVTAATVTSFDYSVTQKGWGVVWKQARGYLFNCTVTGLDTSILNSEQEQIQFGQNWQFFDMHGKFNVGKNYVGDKVHWGSDFLFHSNHNSLTSYSCWGNEPGGIFRNTILRIHQTGTGHGYWTPFGGKSGDIIDGSYQEDNRQWSHANRENALIGTRGYRQHIEPIYGLIQGHTNYGPNNTHGIRLNGNQTGSFAYDCDFSKISGNTLNPYQATNGRVRFHLVDSKWKEGIADENQVYWNYRSGGGLFDALCFESYTILLQINDQKGNPIQGAHVVITNNDGVIVHESYTNEDGYANLDKGTATSGSDTLLTDTTKNWLVTTGYQADVLDEWWQRQLFITGGTGVGQMKQCGFGHTSTTQIPHSAYSIPPDNTSRYIIVPWVDIKTFEGTSYLVNAYSSVLYHNPFHIEVTASGYEKFSKEVTIDKAINETVTLKVRHFPRSQRS